MSGIYIYGMEMPKIGESVTIYPDGRVVRYDTYSGGTIRGKAIPVPEHGDLIEREPILDVMYDRLISKTPEELAEWIESIEPAACPWRDDHGDNCRFAHCRDCWFSWLKSPVDEVGG